MKQAALILLLTLLGCASQPVIPPEPKVIVKIERIVAPIPNALLDIPDPVPNLELEVLKTDDKAVAKWLLDSEERTLNLEGKLRQIRELYIRYLRETKAANAKP